MRSNKRAKLLQFGARKVWGVAYGMMMKYLKVCYADVLPYLSSITGAMHFSSSALAAQLRVLFYGKVLGAIFYLYFTI